jgi:hypothetical protein
MSNSYVVSYATSCDLVFGGASLSVCGPEVDRPLCKTASRAVTTLTTHTSTSRSSSRDPEEWAHTPRVDRRSLETVES